MADVPYRVGVVSVACVCLFFFSIADFIRRLTAAISLYGGRGTCVRRPWYARVAAAVCLTELKKRRRFWQRLIVQSSELSWFIGRRRIFILP